MQESGAESETRCNESQSNAPRSESKPTEQANRRRRIVASSTDIPAYSAQHWRRWGPVGVLQSFVEREAESRE